jgi:hypothetical protein
MDDFIGQRNHPGDGLRLLGMDGIRRKSTSHAARQLNSNSDKKQYTIKTILRGGKLDGFASELVDNLAAVDHFESLLCTSRSAIARAFRSIDSDDSGHFSMAELQSALAKLGVNATASEVDTIFDGLDENKDGSIDFEVPSTQLAPTPCAHYGNSNFLPIPTSRAIQLSYLPALSHARSPPHTRARAPRRAAALATPAPQT